MKLKVKFPDGVKLKHTPDGLEAEYDDKAAAKYFEAKVINTKKNNIVTDDKRITVTKNQKLKM